MEGFRYLKGSHNPSSDTLHSLPASGPVSRLIGRHFLRREWSWMSLEEDLPSGHGPCIVELLDHDSSLFRAVVEPHVDWEFETRESNDEDLNSSPPLPHWEAPDYSEPVEPEDPTQNTAMEKDDFDAALSQGFAHCGIFGEGMRYFGVGLALHVLGICLLLWVLESSPKGLGGISDNPIFVRLHECGEIDSSEVPSRASVDSPASAAAIARRQPKEEEKKPPVQPEKETLPEERAEEITERPEREPPPTEEKPEKDTVPAHDKIRPEASVPDGPRIDSKNPQDSVASMSSVAVQEKKGAVKSGEQVVRYNDKILAAIHQAAYYPGAALRRPAYGRTVVRFTVNKDGRLADVSIVGHSESKELDEAAVKIVHQAASHFPPIPDELMRDHVTFVIPIVFKKRG